VRDETVTTRRTEEPCADVCKAFGWRCQLPTGHGGEHVYESEVERVTWTPRRQQDVAESLDALEALRRYGDHDRSCGVRLSKSCSCGFAAAAGMTAAGER
jgi:hypothetical protein